MTGRIFTAFYPGFLLLCLSFDLSAQSTQTVVRSLPTRLNPPATAPPASVPIEHFVPQAHPPGTEISDSILAWDAPAKTYTAKSGELEALFVFNVTNVSAENVTIHSVSTSCGCTVAQLPNVPWVIAPGSNGQIHATMNLAGKIGHVTKALTIHSDKGERTLLVHASIPTGVPHTTGVIPLVDQREANRKIAQADRQAVFRGDCAKCHVPTSKESSAQALYTSACGVCHDSSQRAAMVPDLHHLNHETTPAYWKEWITQGKVGTLMPAFAQSEGGPLSPAQIDSLVEYLSQTIVAHKPGGD